MTDEQWKEVEKKLVPPFGRVELEIDGYKVTITAQLVEKMKFSFVVYVNGFIRAEWSMNDCEIRRRFYYESKKSLLKGSEKAKIKKMRKSVREEIMKSAQYSVFLPYWGSFSRLKSHLIKNNQSIELVE
ncbi:MAG: hypothetical protein ACLSG5_05275 [Oscillospiraceae bacterium]|jgi:hypothetical protein